MPIKNYPTQKSLREILHYNPTTGQFTWKIWKGARGAIGSIAGSKHRSGYVRIQLDGKLYLAHRLAFLYMAGRLPAAVDHIDHCRNNNKWQNLRPADWNINSKNKRLSAKNKSGCPDVGWHIKHEKWQVRITVNHKRIYLGIFGNLDDAIAIRKAAEQKYGYHSNHGV